MNFNIVFYSTQINLVSFFFHKNYSYFHLIHTYLLFWTVFSTLKFRKKNRRKKKFFKYYKKPRVRLMLSKNKFLKQPLESFFLPKRTNHHFFMNSGGRFKPVISSKSFGLKVPKIIKKRRRLKSCLLFKNFFLSKFNAKNKKSLFLFPKLLEIVPLSTHLLNYSVSKINPSHYYNSKKSKKSSLDFFFKPKLFSFKKKRKNYYNPTVFIDKLENRLGNYSLKSLKMSSLVGRKSTVISKNNRTYFNSLTNHWTNCLVRFKSSRRRQSKRKTKNKFSRIIQPINVFKKKKRILLSSKTKTNNLMTKSVDFKDVTGVSTTSKVKVQYYTKSFSKVSNTLLNMHVLSVHLRRYSMRFKKFTQTTFKQLFTYYLRFRFYSLKSLLFRRLRLNRRTRRSLRAKLKRRKRYRIFTFIRFIRRRLKLHTCTRQLQIRGIFSDPSFNNIYLSLFATPLLVLLPKYNFTKALNLRQRKRNLNTLFLFFNIKYTAQKWFYISRHLLLPKKPLNFKFFSKKKNWIPKSWIFSKYGHPFILYSTGLKFYKRFKFKFKKPMSHKILKSYYSFLKVNELKKFTFDYVKKKFFGFFKRRLIFCPTFLKGIIKNISYFSFFKNLNSSRFSTITGPSLLATNEVFSFSNLDKGDFIETLHKQHQSRELYVPRIKFKPGYMRIWRHFRLAFAEALNFKYIYQQQLTKHLSRFSRRVNQHYFQFWENNIVYMFIYSQLIPDEGTFNLFLSSHFLYLNSQPILTKNLSVYPNDFMQVLISNWYYIFSRWLTSFVRLRHLKFRRLVFRKSATSRYRSMKRAKQKSFYTPNWIYYVKHDYLDIKSFFEVDFFTLSCFCIYDPAIFMYHSPRDFKVIRWHVIRLYNWKYIN